MTKLKTVGMSLVLISSFTNADNYTTPLHEVEWTLNRGDVYCQLTQDIPLYGLTDFMHQSGELLRFSIKENRFKSSIINASLTIENSSWIHQAKPGKNFLVNLDHAEGIQHYPRLSVYGEVAESMLDALLKGLTPTFSYQRKAYDGENEETNVEISSVNFLNTYNQFADCRKDFLPYGFKDSLEKSIFFKPKSKVLNASVLQQLQDTVRYVNEIKGAGVVIVSETEIAGKPDKTWFLKRANKIAAKLNQLGLPKNKVSVSTKREAAKKDNKFVQLGLFGPDGLRTIYYRKGNVNLTQTEKKRLSVLAQYAEEFLPNSKIVIRSHTDSKGSKATNLRVSKKRGHVIKQYLLSIGVDKKKVIVKAYGESKPVRINRFEAGRAANRRVNIDFVIKS